jgi:hypothetical protein
MSESMSFDEWKLTVYAYVDGMVGLSCDDLPDCPYYDWFRAGMTPREAAVAAVRYAQDLDPDDEGDWDDPTPFDRMGRLMEEPKEPPTREELRRAYDEDPYPEAD